MSAACKLIPSDAGCRIVTEPYLVGPELQTLARQCSMDFLRSQPFDEMEAPLIIDILMGGRFYGLTQAWKEVFPKTECGHAEIRAKRSCQEGEWKVRVWYDEEASICLPKDHPDPLEATKTIIRSAKTILIGDTVATGTTLHGVLSWIAEVREGAPANVHIFSIAGTSFCLPKLNKLAVAYPTWSFNLILANIDFNLHSNGTDLQFTGATMLPTASTYFNGKLGDFQHKMKCGIWDWGDRFNCVKEHLTEIGEYFEKLPDTPKWILESIHSRKAEAEHEKPAGGAVIPPGTLSTAAVATEKADARPNQDLKRQVSC